MSAGHLLPFSGGTDQPISHKAEPEIDQQANINSKGVMTWQREGWREQEVCNIAQHDRREGLDEIY
jgi:hypothetical protein